MEKFRKNIKNFRISFEKRRLSNKYEYESNSLMEYNKLKNKYI